MKIPNVVLAPARVRLGKGREGRRPHCGPGKVDPHIQGSTLGAAALYSLPGAADLRGPLDQADSYDAEWLLREALHGFHQILRVYAVHGLPRWRQRYSTRLPTQET